MSVTCVTCTHADARIAPKIGEQGFVSCKARPEAGRYLSAIYPRECAKFVALPAEDVERRREWLKKQRGVQR